MDNITLRMATPGDIDAINRVIESAVMGWDLAERVKRLSLSSYRYTEMDFQYLQMVVAESKDRGIVGIAAWETADAKDAPPGKCAMLLHGIYVTSSMHGHGIGQRLFRYVEHAIDGQPVDGMLVKAQADATGFFESQGMQHLPSDNEYNQYANRYWKERGLSPRNS